MSASPRPQPRAEPASREEALADLSDAMKGLLAAGRRLRTRESRAADGFGLPLHFLLWSLHVSGEMTSGQLAQAVEVSPATITAMLDAAVAAGLVSQRRAAGDRRVVLNSLTVKGRRDAERRHAAFRAAFAEALADVPVEELRASATVLARLERLLDGLSPVPPG